MGSELLSFSNKLTNTNDVQEFVASELGIKCSAIHIDNDIAIKVNNHMSLFSLINKIRRKADFEVYHKKENNEFIIKIKLL